MQPIKIQKNLDRYKNPFKDYKADIFERLTKYKFICTKESEKIRKYAHDFIKHGYPIKVMHCDCGKYERVHNMYYYEWALDFRN